MNIKHGCNRTTLHISNGHVRRSITLHANLFHPNGHSAAERIDRELGAKKRRALMERIADRDLALEVLEHNVQENVDAIVVVITKDQSGACIAHVCLAGDQDDFLDDADVVLSFSPKDAAPSEWVNGQWIEDLLDELDPEPEPEECLFEGCTSLIEARLHPDFLSSECPMGHGFLDPDGSCSDCGYIEDPATVFELAGLDTRTLAQLHAYRR